MVPLARILEQTARRHHEADKPALVGATTSYTYREAADRMWRLARALRASGVGPGDRVSVLSANSADYLLLFAAVSAIGAATVPMSPRWTAAEVADAVAYVRPVLVVASADHADVAGGSGAARVAVGDLVRAQPEIGADLSALRFCISAGSPLLSEASSGSSTPSRRTCTSTTAPPRRAGRPSWSLGTSSASNAASGSRWRASTCRSSGTTALPARPARSGWSASGAWS